LSDLAPQPNRRQIFGALNTNNAKAKQ